jgi:hypothetical protein
MAELALNDVQRHALPGELERVAQLMRCEPAPDARLGPEPPELAAVRGEFRRVATAARPVKVPSDSSPTAC